MLLACPDTMTTTSSAHQYGSADVTPLRVRECVIPDMPHQLPLIAGTVPAMKRKGVEFRVIVERSRISSLHNGDLTLLDKTWQAHTGGGRWQPKSSRSTGRKLIPVCY